MPRTVVITRRFEQAYRKLSVHEQQIIDASLRQFHAYLQTGHVPVGLGLKQLYRRTYEFRAGLALRVVYVLEEATVSLALLGRHDDVRQFLKRQ